LMRTSTNGLTVDAQTGVITSTLSGGCNPVATTTWTGTIPQYNDGGGSITVYWEIEDLCYSNTVSATYNIEAPEGLSGYVTYFIFTGVNDPVLNSNIPLEGFIVELLDDDVGVLTTVYTDDEGFYEFTNPDHVANAAYIQITSILPHGGMSAIDALAIQRRAAALPVSYFYPETFKEHISNVNKLNGVDTGDAALVQWRSIFPNNPFDAGEWAFAADPIFLGNFENVHVNDEPSFTARRPYDRNVCTMNVLARAYGDVRGTYNFSTATTMSVESIHSDEVTHVEPGEVFTLPITLKRDLVYSAMRLDIPYDNSKVEIIDILSEMPGLIYDVREESIQVSWFDLSPNDITRNDAILHLQLKTIDDVSAEDMIFYKGENTEFGDVLAEPIQDVELKISRINNGIVTGMEVVAGSDLNLNVYPNPFSDQLHLEYELNKPSQVRVTMINTMGAIVAELVNKKQSAGSHSHTYQHPSMNYQRGIYLLRIEIFDGENTHLEARRLLFER